MAAGVGKPRYCLMSALSMKARSMDSVIFDVVRIKTLEWRLIWSIWVKTALTTRMESDGSFPVNNHLKYCPQVVKKVPEMHWLRAWANDSISSIKTHTNKLEFSTISVIFVNIFVTSLPLCKKRMNRCRQQKIQTHFWKPFWKQTVTVNFNEYTGTISLLHSNGQLLG